ncbi:Biogenesis of lysosome-related organelles complex 1 subunit BLS1 [Nakaseomyces bracarensis]|uniref:Biogenesis of lysosome-related organelles complex 1 subunit BLS1 n=1 Tax=Nakaseomyces bracarensis TaxID=273131 RepID=A0ABR4NZ43_9SACH
MQANNIKLESIVERILHDNTLSEPGKALKELEDNGKYIMEVQMKKLMKLHDDRFMSKSVLPMERLYSKYSQVKERFGDLQKDAELVDRDIRIIEMAIDDIKKNRDS